MQSGLYRFNNMMAAPEDAEWSIGTPLETATAGTMGLMDYLTDLAKERRRAPGTDLISLLAQAELDGQLLPDDHLGFNGIMFFAAGHETDARRTFGRPARTASQSRSIRAAACSTL